MGVTAEAGREDEEPVVLQVFLAVAFVHVHPDGLK
jgi:hypothetical protein